MEVLRLIGEGWANLTHDVAERDYPIEALTGKNAQVLGVEAFTIDPKLGQRSEDEGMHLSGIAAGTGDIHHSAALLAKDRLRHLGASAVVGAEEQDRRDPVWMKTSGADLLLDELQPRVNHLDRLF